MSMAGHFGCQRPVQERTCVCGVSIKVVKMLLALAIVMLAVIPAAAMQETVANPAKAGLEIASITPKASGTTASGGIRFQPKGGELRATDVTLAELIKFAYQRHFFDEREVTGGPAWATSDRFDLLVKVSGGHVFDADGVPRKTLALLKALLVERFKLKVREEYRERPVYALTTALRKYLPDARNRQPSLEAPRPPGDRSNRAFRPLRHRVGSCRNQSRTRLQARAK